MKKYYVIENLKTGGYFYSHQHNFKGIIYATRYLTKGAAEDVIFGFSMIFGDSTYEIKEIYER